MNFGGMAWFFNRLAGQGAFSCGGVSLSWHSHSHRYVLWLLLQSMHSKWRLFSHSAQITRSQGGCRFLLFRAGPDPESAAAWRGISARAAGTRAGLGGAAANRPPSGANPRFLPALPARAPMKALAVAAIAAAGIAAGTLSAGLLAGEPDGLTPSAIEAGGSPRLGDDSAPITIVEYGDYQCTYCFRFHRDTLPQLMEYVGDGRASLVFQDFPLNGDDSVLAAEASRCAAEQGLYWEYHDQLYRNWGGERTGWVTRQALESFAADVGAEARPFASCLDDGRHRAAVLESYERGGSVGIDATPSFLIFDGQSVVKVRGNQPAEVFHRILQSLGQT